MLYIVPTPIGNLEDITLRSKKALSEADFLIAENPSTTKKLLNLLGITKKEVVQLADHNEARVLDTLIEKPKTQSACLVSDAGTPTISDPGFKLVRECRKNNIEIISLPGATAITTALAGSGLPTDKFIFSGFFPKTEIKVCRQIEEAKNIEATLIAYESPQRLIKTLEIINKNFSDAKVVVARELTKMHEEFVYGTIKEVLEKFKTRQSIKGEIVILISFK